MSCALLNCCNCETGPHSEQKVSFAAAGAAAEIGNKMMRISLLFLMQPNSHSLETKEKVWREANIFLLPKVL